MAMLLLTINGPSIQKAWKKHIKESKEVVNYNHSKSSFIGVDTNYPKAKLGNEPLKDINTETLEKITSKYLNPPNLMNISEVEDSVISNTKLEVKNQKFINQKSIGHVPINTAFSHTDLSPQNKFLLP